jgi:quercetin dioxygenase-like cupin family protein
MTASDPARAIRPAERVEADPTPGMLRERAIDVEGMWAGFVRTAPGITSGWHHHGDYDTSIYVTRGTLRLESGPGGAEIVRAIVGDFVHIPKGAVHREGNDGDEESELVVVRAGLGPLTVNVEGPSPSP